MPYDPAKPEVFAAILNRLAKAGLSSDKMVELWKLRRPRRVSDDEFPLRDLSRVTLDRFRSGKPVRAGPALRHLWTILEAHPDYAAFFPPADAPPPPPSPEIALSSALRHYFAGDTQAGVRLNLDAIQKRMHGTYIAYRRTWRLADEHIMTTKMEILESAEGRSVFESQNFPPSDNYTAHVQKDAGFMFAFGRYVYFLTGGTSGDTSLKLWVVEVMEPNDLTVPLSYFHGTLYVAGPERPFPAVKFFCKRQEACADISFEYLKLDEIEDKQVRRHFEISGG